MMRLIALVTMLISLLLPVSQEAQASALPSPLKGEGLGVRVPYAPSITGTVAGFRLAGIEPDGDPLYQTVLQTTLSASGGMPSVHLIVDSYLENFQPDTTPILPDLLHPNQTAQNLGGFLDGKALLTDDAGHIVSVGTFLAEAFLDNSNHAVVEFVPANAPPSAASKLKGTFQLRKNGTLSGALAGQLKLAPAILRQVRANQGAKMRPLKQIIDQVTVHPHPMMGKASTGSSGVPLHTGFGNGKAVHTGYQNTSQSTGRKISPLTIVAGIGAIVSLFLAAFLYWSERRRNKQGNLSPTD
jgi:hypothetical protein